MLSVLLALTVPVSVIALLFARWEYSTKGKLSLVGMALLCTMLFVPNLVLHYIFDYVGWVLFILGFALNDWSPWSLDAVLVVAISLHFLVLIEEEHLLRTFGEPYAELLRTARRYL